RTRIWALGEEEFRRRLSQAVGDLPPGRRLPLLLETIDEESEASFEIGRAIAEMEREGDDPVAELARVAANGLLTPISGFLWVAVEQANKAAFDEFLDGPLGRALSPEKRLA